MLLFLCTVIRLQKELYSFFGENVGVIDKHKPIYSNYMNRYIARFLSI